MSKPTHIYLLIHDMDGVGTSHQVFREKDKDVAIKQARHTVRRERRRRGQLSSSYDLPNLPGGFHPDNRIFYASYGPDEDSSVEVLRLPVEA